MSTRIQYGYDGAEDLDVYIQNAVRGKDLTDQEKLEELTIAFGRLVDALVSRTTALRLDEVEEIIGVYDKLRYAE